MRVSRELAKVSGALRCSDVRDSGNCRAYRLEETPDEASLRRIRTGTSTPADTTLVPSLYQIVQYGKTHIPHYHRRR